MPSKSLSTKKTTPAEKTADNWGPQEFLKCRQRALRARPSSTAEQEKWLREKMDLVWAYRFGYGTEPNRYRYFELLEQVAELEEGSAIGAKWHLALAHKEGIGTRASETLYIRWMQRAAADGDSEAMFNLAQAYQDGAGVERDESEYISWISKMAEKGSPSASISLAEAYRFGIGIRQDDAMFFENAKNAVAQAEQKIGNRKSDPDFASEDLPRALYLVAEAFRHGTGIESDREQYFSHLSKAVDAADKEIEALTKDERQQAEELRTMQAPFKLELAEAYMAGIGTVTDEERAIGHMKQAADAGNAKAMLKVAELYESGRMQEPNLKEAFVWKEKAAGKHAPDALYSTAVAYGTGAGIEENPAEFQRLVREAVRAGHETAYMAVGLAVLREANLICGVDVSRFLELFEELRRVVLEVKLEHQLQSSDTSGEVAHFTTFEALHSMLPREIDRFDQTRREQANLLRLYNLAYVNDPQEGQMLLSNKAAETDLIDEFFSKSPLTNLQGEHWLSHEPLPLSGLAFSVYVGSFTLESDRLDLWRAYGRDGEGFCIVTPVGAFTDLNSHMVQGFAGLAATDQSNWQVPMTLYRVLYEEQDIIKTIGRIKPHLTSIRDNRERITSSREHKRTLSEHINLTVRAILSDILYLYKNEEYKRENEVRMLAPCAITAPSVNADEQNPAKLFVKSKPFLFKPGSRIILGPRVKEPDAVRLELRHRLDRNGHLDVEVTFSPIPYR